MVIEVVLHQHADARPLGKQAAQQPRLVHGPQREAHPAAAPHQLQQAVDGLRGRPVPAVHQMRTVPQLEAQLLRQLRALELRHLDGVQQGRRLTQEVARGATGVQTAVAQIEVAAQPRAQRQRRKVALKCPTATPGYLGGLEYCLLRYCSSSLTLFHSPSNESL